MYKRQILPIPVVKLFTYQVNEDEARFLKPGMRVAVPFGKSKVYSALVHSIHTRQPAVYQAKEIDHILDEAPIVNQMQIKHWEWIASYYMCALGEVYRAAIPSAFLLESETSVHKTDAVVKEEDLADDEFLIYEALQYQSSLKIDDLRSILDSKKVLSVIHRLLGKGVIHIEETLQEKYVPKLVKFVRLHPIMENDKALNEALDGLTRAKKQREMVLSFFAMKASSLKGIKASELIESSKGSMAVLQALHDKNILELYAEQRDRVNFEERDSSVQFSLSDPQQEALHSIKEQWVDKNIVLLHGVTAAGKTEIYAKLMEQVVAEGKQILFLLPEIALTAQLIQRLQDYFGNIVGVYHSKYSVHERVELWNNVLDQSPKTQIILGARSALFLPFSNLGLIVIDEEHESSFKQFDPAPRYHARDSALVLAHMHQAKALLGSASPSLESYYNAITGKYGLTVLTKRYGNILLPDITLVDLKEKYRKKRMSGHFSDTLIEAIREVLDQGEQVILFQNRRGYSPIIECKTCGNSPQCPHCDVSLTYHQYKNQLRCHYCGYHMAMPLTCPACHSVELDSKGLGTEQVVKELEKLFPDTAIGRMDQDTTRGKFGHEKIITAFEQEEIDILVGTQMVTKGLDFKKVRLVGVMNADNLINFPDFRAHERTFQLLLQVAGRAGRSQMRGKVLIQTYNPLHQVLQQVTMHDYENFSKEQLYERRNFKYPPYYRLIRMTFKQRDFNRVNEGADWFYKALRSSFAKQTDIEFLGPEFPPVSRIKNEYLKHILIKIPVSYNVGQVKNVLTKLTNSFQAVPQFRSIRLICNVDA